MFVDPRTAASNPARIRINLIHYTLCHPTDLIVGIVSVVVGVAAALIAWHPVPLVFCAVGLWLFFQGLMTARAKFRSGDVCAAVVVSENPYRIAVYTDMSTRGANNKPAILIKRAPLSRMTGGPPAVGQRLATVALYQGVMNEDAWRNFDPTVLACATTNEADIARVTASILQPLWRQLDGLLKRLPDRKEGMYKLWLGTQNQYIGGFKKGALTAVVLLALATPVIAIVANAAKKGKQASSSGGETEAPTRVTPSSPRRSRPIETPQPSPAPAPIPRAPVIPSPRPRTTSRASPTASPPRPAVTPPPPPPPIPAPASAPSASGNYVVSQKVESQEKSGKWSEATILKVQGAQYFVHYDGWSDAWDEWVPPNRLRPRLPVGGDFAVGAKVDIHEKRTRWTAGTILKRDGKRYFVHHDGWSDAWDEWVDDDQVRPRR